MAPVVTSNHRSLEWNCRSTLCDSTHNEIVGLQLSFLMDNNLIDTRLLADIELSEAWNARCSSNQ